jgi:F-type H+-transporting ATPase subunit b
MRTTLLSILATLTAALAGAPLAGQEGAPPAGGGILSPNVGVMVWTLVIFVVLLLVLSRYAFKPITAAVAAREAALERAIADAKRDRDEARRLAEEQRAALDAARAEAQRYVAEGRAAGEQVRSQILEQAHGEQAELLERVRREIAHERDRAIADLRREAVELAIRGAGKVIERNLDDQSNRRIVEDFLATTAPRGARG